MSATSARDQSARVAAVDPAAALRIARTIGDAWYRCQALAIAAWHAVEPKGFHAIIAEALESGWSIDDPNRAATVVAWPVAALAGRRFDERGANGRTDRELARCLARVGDTVSTLDKPARRGDALLMHVHALSPSQARLRASVLSRLVKECLDPANGKGERQLEEAALVVAGDDPVRAIELAAHLREARRARTVERIEPRGEGLGPRRFF